MDADNSQYRKSPYIAGSQDERIIPKRRDLQSIYEYLMNIKADGLEVRYSRGSGDGGIYFSALDSISSAGPFEVTVKEGAGVNDSDVLYIGSRGDAVESYEGYDVPELISNISRATAAGATVISNYLEYPLNPISEKTQDGLFEGWLEPGNIDPNTGVPIGDWWYNEVPGRSTDHIGRVQLSGLKSVYFNSTGGLVEYDTPKYTTGVFRAADTIDLHDIELYKNDLGNLIYSNLFPDNSIIDTILGGYHRQFILYMWINVSRVAEIGEMAGGKDILYGFSFHNRTYTTITHNINVVPTGFTTVKTELDYPITVPVISIPIARISLAITGTESNYSVSVDRVGNIRYESDIKHTASTSVGEWLYNSDTNKFKIFDCSDNGLYEVDPSTSGKIYGYIDLIGDMSIKSAIIKNTSTDVTESPFLNLICSYSTSTETASVAVSEYDYNALYAIKDALCKTDIFDFRVDVNLIAEEESTAYNVESIVKNPSTYVSPDVDDTHTVDMYIYYDHSTTSVKGGTYASVPSDEAIFYKITYTYDLSIILQINRYRSVVVQNPYGITRTVQITDDGYIKQLTFTRGLLTNYSETSI